MKPKRVNNFGRVARDFDQWLQTDLEAEKAHAREIAIENKATELYREMLDSPEDLAEALSEAYSQDWMEFAAAMGNALRDEIPSWDIQHLAKIKSAAKTILQEESKRQALSWFESL